MCPDAMYQILSYGNILTAKFEHRFVGGETLHCSPILCARIKFSKTIMPDKVERISWHIAVITPCNLPFAVNDNSHFCFTGQCVCSRLIKRSKTSGKEFLNSLCAGVSTAKGIFQSICAASHSNLLPRALLRIPLVIASICSSTEG